MNYIVDFINSIMPQGYEIQSWMVEIFTVLLFTAFVSLIARGILARIELRADKTQNWLDDALVRALRRPVGVMIWVVGLIMAADIAFIDDATVLAYVAKIRSVSIILILSWAAMRFIRKSELYYNSQVGKKKIDETTLAAISKLTRISIFISATLISLQTIGISVSAVMAAGGVGGLAIGFAAKDLLANFFGALMIYLDRPFKVGDWIRSPDQQIEGTVEEIGWRATKIRTFDKRPLYVPNSVFTRISVENPSRMTNRRIKETIGIRYNDMAQVKSITAEIREMLLAHEEIDTTQTLFVHLNGFGASSVDLYLYCFTKTTAWVPFHGIKEDVLLKIADIISAHKAEIAFPTQTLHVELEKEEVSEVV